MKTFLLAALLIGVGIALMCVKIIFKKGGRFPSGHVHDLPQLQRRGARCPSRQ